MEQRLVSIPADAPIFTVELPHIVIIVTRARDHDDAISRARTLAMRFFRLEATYRSEEGVLCRPAAADEIDAYLAAESNWHGEVSLAAAFIELT